MDPAFMGDFGALNRPHHFAADRPPQVTSSQPLQHFAAGPGLSQPSLTTGSGALPSGHQCHFMQYQPLPQHLLPGGSVQIQPLSQQPPPLPPPPQQPQQPPPQSQHHAAAVVAATAFEHQQQIATLRHQEIPGFQFHQQHPPPAKQANVVQGTYRSQSQHQRLQTQQEPPRIYQSHSANPAFLTSTPHPPHRSVQVSQSLDSCNQPQQTSAQFHVTYAPHPPSRIIFPPPTRPTEACISPTPINQSSGSNTSQDGRIQIEEIISERSGEGTVEGFSSVESNPIKKQSADSATADNVVSVSAGQSTPEAMSSPNVRTPTSGPSSGPIPNSAGSTTHSSTLPESESSNMREESRFVTSDSRPEESPHARQRHSSTESSHGYPSEMERMVSNLLSNSSSASHGEDAEEEERSEKTRQPIECTVAPLNTTTAPMNDEFVVPPPPRRRGRPRTRARLEEAPRKTKTAARNSGRNTVRAAVSHPTLHRQEERSWTTYRDNFNMHLQNMLSTLEDGGSPGFDMHRRPMIRRPESDPQVENCVLDEARAQKFKRDLRELLRQIQGLLPPRKARAPELRAVNEFVSMMRCWEEDECGGGGTGGLRSNDCDFVLRTLEETRRWVLNPCPDRSGVHIRQRERNWRTSASRSVHMMMRAVANALTMPPLKDSETQTPEGDDLSSSTLDSPPPQVRAKVMRDFSHSPRRDEPPDNDNPAIPNLENSSTNHFVAGGDVNRSENRSHVHPYIQTPVARAVVNRGNDMHRPRAIRATRRQQEGSNATEAGSAPTRVLEFRATPRSQACNSLHTTRGPETEAPADVLLTKTRMVALNRAPVASSSNHQNYRGSNSRQQPLPSDTSSQTSSSSWKKPPNNTFRPPTPPVRNSSTPNRQQHRLAAMRNIRAQPPQTDSGASASASASASVSARSTNGDSRRATERDSSEENHDWVYLKRGTYSTPLKEHASHRSSTGGVTGPSSGSAVSLISAASGGMSGPAAIALTCGRASSPGSDERRISPQCPGDTGCPKEPTDLRPSVEKSTSHDVSHEIIHAQGISTQMCDYAGETRERQDHMGPGRSDSHVPRTSNSVSHTMIKKAALSRGKQYRSSHSIDPTEHQNVPKFSISTSQESDNLHIRGWQENTAHIPPFHPDTNLNHNYRNCSNTNIHESSSNRSETNHLANTCQIIPKSEQSFLPDTNRVGWHVPHATSSRYPSNSGVVKSCYQPNGSMSQGDSARHEYHTNAFNQTRGNYVTSVQDIRCHRPEMMDTNQKSRQMCEPRESQDTCRLQNCQKSPNDVKNVQSLAYRDHLYPCNQSNRCPQRQTTYKDNDFQRIKDIPCQQSYMGLGHEPPLVYPSTTCRMNANVNHAENWPLVNTEASNARQVSQIHTDVNPSGHNGMKISQRSDCNISFGINSNAPPYVPPPDRNRTLYENCDKSSENRSLRSINNTNNSTISYCGQKRQAECKYSSQVSEPLHLPDHVGRSGFSTRNGQSAYRVDSLSVEHCNAYNNPSNSMGDHWETPNVRAQTWNYPENHSASQILQGDSSDAAENNVNQYHFAENMQENIQNSWQSFSSPSGCAVQQQHEAIPQCNSPEFEVAVKQERTSPCRYPVYDHLVPQIPLPVSDVKLESEADDEETNPFPGTAKSYVPSREAYELYERNSRKTTQAIRQSDNRKTFVQEVENLKEDTSKKDKNGEKINFAHSCSLMAEKLITKPSSVDSCLPFSLRSEGERPCCENEPNDSRKNDKSDSHPSNENDQRVENDWQTFRQCGKARKSKDCERKELSSRKGEDVCAEGVLLAEPGPRSTPSSLYALSKSCEEEDRTAGRCSPAGSSHSQKRKRDDHGESLAQAQRKLGAPSTAAMEKTAADNGLSQELDSAPSIKHMVVESKRASPPDAKGMGECIRTAFFTSKMQDMIASKLLSKQPDEDVPVSIKDVLVKVKQNKYSSVHHFALETRKIIQAAKKQFEGEKLRTILDASNKFELSLLDHFPSYDLSPEAVASESEENPSLESEERHKKPPKHFYKGATGHESRKARHQTRTEHEGVGGDGASNAAEVVVRDSTTRPEVSVNMTSSADSNLTYVNNSFTNAQRPPPVIWPPVPRRNSEISNPGACSIVTAAAPIRVRARNQNRRTT